MATSTKKRIALGCLALVFAGAGLFVFSARRFLFPKHYDVVSIQRDPAYQNHALLERAFSMPVAALYQRGPIVFQPNGSVCGPTSLANVLRSEGNHDATPASVLAGSDKCPFGFCLAGITLDQLADIARVRTRERVTVLRDLSLTAFRAELAHVNDASRRYIVNFTRGPLFGTDGGHHSPIAAYLADRDLVLVVDVNARYRPWLVTSERLFRAMDTIDPSTGKKRGLLRIEHDLR